MGKVTQLYSSASAETPAAPWEDIFEEIDGTIAAFEAAAEDLERLLGRIVEDDETPVAVQDAAGSAEYVCRTCVREIRRPLVRLTSARLDATQAIVDAEVEAQKEADINAQVEALRAERPEPTTRRKRP